jgi:alkanesulfonate monooxygenase SsuD/methylene tetrahydromethanopterin reductase-like flavin-dependent oxidoreductase (luciferase family)
MPDIGIMLEGQEGMTWQHLFRLADAAEALGFESLFRSDHLTALDGFAERNSLALWPSLGALAARTRRLRFGPLVCSITFHHPALLAKNAAAVDQLSGGRFELGLGAGWYAGEHRRFGVPYPPYAARLEMLDEGARVIQALWAGGPVSLAGKHFSLAEAETYPLPAQKPMPLIMGGKGHRTLQIVARYASEWNCSYVGLPVFIEKSRELDDDCRAIGRDPAAIRRSLMLPFVIGRQPAAVQARIDEQRATFPNLPADLAGWHAAGFLGGSPAQLTEQIQQWAAAGCTRFMLQHSALDDLDSLELLASEVLPHVS